MKLEKLLISLMRTKKVTCAERTTDFYDSHVRSVSNYFKSRNISEIEELTFDDILDYIESMKDSGIKAKTINHRMSIVKQLIKMVPDDQLTFDHYQILHLKKSPVEPKSYMPLQKEELFKFIGWVKELPNKHKSLKKKVMFLICIQNGIRANELLELKVRDLLLDDKRIKLTHTKCHSVRYAYFNDYTQELLKQYLAMYRPENYLFQNDITKEKLGIQGFEDMFRVASKHVGFKVTSHILRATFATSMLRNGCNIESVRVMMGHTNIRTTQMYLHMTDDEIWEDNINYNPLTQYDNYINTI